MSERSYHMFGSMNTRPVKSKGADIKQTQRSDAKTTEPRQTNRNPTRVKPIERRTKAVAPVSEEERLQQRFEDLKTTARTWVYTGDLRKAIDCFTKVLEIEPQDTESRVSRASCHLDLAHYPEAVQDAQTVIAHNGDHAKAHSIKAEAHFQQGEFEDALVHFHRANKLRPNLKENERGIDKAKCAIENSVGDAANLKLEKSGDLSYFDEQKNRSRSSHLRRSLSNLALKKQDTSMKGQSREDSKLSKDGQQKKKSQNAKTIKQLLGELYGDWKFLDQLLNEEESVLKEMNKGDRAADSKKYISRQYREEAKKERKMKERIQREYEAEGMHSSRSDAPPQRKHISEALRDLALSELKYLEQRKEFWRQNKPPKTSSARKDGDSRDDEFIQILEEIQKDQADGNYAASLDKSDTALKLLSAKGATSVENRTDYEATIYSLMGTAYYETEQYKNALKYFKKDLALAKEHKLKDAHSRALDNIGRVYAKTEKYSLAVKVFEEKLPMAADALERTWLHHELGRCYLEMKKYKKAAHHGKKSLKNAELVDDSSWRLNAHVLIAQAQVGQHHYEGALEVFENAMQIAEEDNDEAAQEAISNAMQDLKDRADQDDRDDDKTKDKMDGEYSSDQSDTEQAGAENERNSDLVGQHHYEGALEVFENAMQIAEEDNDEAAQEAISNAMQDLKDRADQDDRDDDKTKDKMDGEYSSDQSDTEQAGAENERNSDLDYTAILTKGKPSKTSKKRERRKFEADYASVQKLTNAGKRDLATDGKRPEDITKIIKKSNAEENSDSEGKQNNSLWAPSSDKDNGNETPKPRDIAADIKQFREEDEQSENRNERKEFTTDKDGPPRPIDIAADIKESNAEDKANKAKDSTEDPLFGGQRKKSESNSVHFKLDEKEDQAIHEDSLFNGSNAENQPTKGRSESGTQEKDDDPLFGTKSSDSKSKESLRQNEEKSGSKQEVFDYQRGNKSYVTSPQKASADDVPSERDIVAEIKAANEKEKKTKEEENYDFFD